MIVLQLRDYQTDAINALYDYWNNEKGKNGLIVCPTGSGKSVIIAELCRQICTEYPNVKILVITHTKEIISQNVKELRNIYPSASIGIFSAGLGLKQTQAVVTFASIQSVYDKVFKFDKIDIILADECDMISMESQVRYK